MRRILMAAAATLALCAAPAMARMGEAYTTDDVNLRAGPDVDYPRVAHIPEGEPVDVRGCLEDWSWCDVVAYGERGWIRADFLEYDYDGRMVLIPDYGPQLGFSIVAFSLGPYWDRHYRHHAWYGRRDYWRNYAYSHPHRYSGGYSHYRNDRGTYYRGGQTRYDTRTYDNRTYSNRTYDNRATTRSGTYVAPSGSVRSTTNNDWRLRAREQQQRQQSTAYQRQVERNATQQRIERNAQAQTDYRASQRARAEQTRAAERQQQASNRQAERNQQRAERDNARERAQQQREAQFQQRQAQSQQREQVRSQVAQQRQQQQVLRAEQRQAQAEQRNERQAGKRQVARNKKDKDKDEHDKR